MPELDAPTEAIPQVAVGCQVDEVGPAASLGVDYEPAWLGWVMWCRDHEYLLAAVIAGAMVALALVLSALNSGSSTTSSSPARSSYQQGYAYGQTLDHEGYGSNEAYQACRGRVSQQQDDIGTFQMACDIGYAQ